MVAGPGLRVRVLGGGWGAESRQSGRRAWSGNGYRYVKSCAAVGGEYRGRRGVCVEGPCPGWQVGRAERAGIPHPGRGAKKYVAARAFPSAPSTAALARSTVFVPWLYGRAPAVNPSPRMRCAHTGSLPFQANMLPHACRTLLCRTHLYDLAPRDAVAVQLPMTTDEQPPPPDDLQVVPPAVQPGVGEGWVYGESATDP